ncbi:hypothetical protein ANN_04799 [Periplaneta americana]|uniref:Endonuclease-reverse transcriptase n=1 Tax=Periplaneta americana TaxID=6978 RepID=A0ABQ8TB08_PERAM|nr:hypothetical protein ANN_04799 [Periplaneta americana]
MGNACYYSVEKLLSPSLLTKNLKVRIYKRVILPVILYGCETWTLTLREEHRLRVFENKVLRKIFVAKRDEVTGEWRKLQNTELHTLYSSSDIIRNIKSRRLRWAGYVARMGESRNAYRVLVGRPDGKIPLGRPRRRWEDNNKMDLRQIIIPDFFSKRSTGMEAKTLAVVMAFLIQSPLVLPRYNLLYYSWKILLSDSSLAVLHGTASHIVLSNRIAVVQQIVTRVEDEGKGHHRCCDCPSFRDMKRLVYETPIDTAEDLVARVVEAVHVIRDNVGILERCRHSIVRRYQLCNAFNGRKFEHSL